MFCRLVVLVRLSVPVQVMEWKDSKMTYNVLMGTVNQLILWYSYWYQPAEPGSP